MKRTMCSVFRCLLLAGVVCTLFTRAFAQTAPPTEKPLTFAYLADLHIGSSSSAEDLKASVADLNTQKNIAFVIFAGDITEFGSDEELALAKEIISGLNKPWYILSGNHDSKWSESGCNTFVKVFGYERFTFDMNGIRFAGCNSGPNMRMAPALVPRESMLWLDSLMKATPKTQPIIYINHYPLDDAMLNYGEVLDLLKQRNIQLAMCGHGHANRVLDSEGIPAVMGRSNLQDRNGQAGYTLVTIKGSRIDFRERLASGHSNPIWYTLRMSEGAAFPANMQYPRPDYSVNQKYANIKAVWSVQDNSDIGAGAIAQNGIAVFGNTQGVVKALDVKSGALLWSYTTKGKIFSTPAISGNKVVIASTDQYVYCFDLKKGTKLWAYAAQKSIVASPTIFDGKVFIGGSDGQFRALSLSTGKELWDYAKINGFIESKPLVDAKGAYIGSWGSHLYAFAPKTGKLLWSWTNDKGRMLSPAAVWPVKANGKIFFATPERKTYAVDAVTGKTIWSAPGGREAVGLSADQKQLYVKTMQDTVIAFSTLENTAKILWKVSAGYGYEIAPSPIATQDGYLFIPTDKGVVYALKESNGSVAWVHKLSNALVNYIWPMGNKTLLITTMDGKVELLRYN